MSRSAHLTLQTDDDRRHFTNQNVDFDTSDAQLQQLKWHALPNKTDRHYYVLVEPVGSSWVRTVRTEQKALRI